MTDFYNKNKQVIDNIFFMLVVVVFIYVFIKYLFSYVSPFVFGFLISLALNPAADFFNKKYKVHRGICAFILVILSIFLLIFLGTAIVTKIAREAETLVANLPSVINEVKDAIDNFRMTLDNFLSFVPEDFKEFVDNALIQLTAAATDVLGSSVKSGSISAVSHIPNFLINIVLSFMSAFFFVKDKYVIKALFQKEQVIKLTKRFSILRTGLLTTLSGYIKAQLTIMTVIATICILGLTIMGNPYAIIIGIFMSVVDVFPVLGLGTVLWPWIFYSFIVQNNSQAIGLCIIYIVGLLTRQVLEPKIFGEHIGVHPLLTLMSIYIGLKVFGIIGLLLGPVIAVSMKIMLKRPQEEV